MRYCLYAYGGWIKQTYGLSPNITEPVHHIHLPRVMHSGLTNWARVFDGHFHVPRSGEEYEQFDVVHVNMTTNNIGSIGRMRYQMQYMAKEKRPLIVTNLDYAPEMWEGYSRFDYMLEDINKADRIFCVHPAMADTISLLLDRKVWHIPHPTDVALLKEMYTETRKTDAFPKKSVLFMAHNWDQNYLIPSWVAKKLQSEDIMTCLVGLVNKDKVFLDMVWQEKYDSMPFEQLAEIMARVDCVVDTAFTHSGGRVPVEAAAMGTPCVGSRNVYSIDKLWNLYSIDIMNGNDMYKSIHKAIQDCPVYSPEVNSFGYEQSGRRFMEMIEETV